MDDALCAQVKRKLTIAYNDNDTDQRIMEIVDGAKPELVDMLGIHDPEFDFAEPGTENFLFLAYCKYEYHDAGYDFEDHYAGKIARCREKWMVRQYAEEKASASDV